MCGKRQISHVKVDMSYQAKRFDSHLEPDFFKVALGLIQVPRRRLFIVFSGDELVQSSVKYVFSAFLLPHAFGGASMLDADLRVVKDEGKRKLF